MFDTKIIKHKNIYLPGEDWVGITFAVARGTYTINVNDIEIRCIILFSSVVLLFDENCF